MKTLFLILFVITSSIANAESLKLFTDIEYQQSINGSSQYNESIEGESFEAAVGLKKKLTPWLQVSGGIRYYDETQDIFGQSSSYELTGYFLKIQTVIVLIK